MIHIEIVYNQMLDSSITRPVARHHEALFFISILSIWHKTAAVGAIAAGDLQRRALYGAQRFFLKIILFRMHCVIFASFFLSLEMRAAFTIGTALFVLFTARASILP